MKKVLIGLGAVIVLLIVAAFVIPFFIPVDIYKKQIAEQVRSATGRDLTIKGDLSFSILPSLGLEVNDVAFSNAPGARTPQMVTLKQLVVKLKLIPLLSGEVEIDSFVLVEPVINLEVNRRGRPNWEFQTAKKPAAAKSKTPAKGKQAGSPAGGLAALKLGDVRIVDGRISYADAKGGKPVKISGVNIKVSLPSLESALDIDGRFTWNKQTINLTAHVDKPKALMAAGASGVKLGVTSKLVNFSFGGSVVNSKSPKAGGNVKLDVPSIRQLAAWAGNPIKMAGTGLGPLSIAGKFSFAGKTISFTNAKLALDAIKASGGITLISGRVPTIRGKLDVDRLDLNPYMPPSKTGAPAAKGGAAPKGGGKGAASTGWSKEPIDASALRSVNADLSLSVNAIIFQKIKIGRSVVRINLRGGKLNVMLSEMALYGGKGTGLIALDGSGKTLGVRQRFKLSKVQAGPLLIDAAGFDRLEGTANTNIEVTGRGRSVYDIVASLNGKGATTFLNGAIKGMNLASMARSVSLSALREGFSGAKKTDFAELSGTYVIKQGVLTNNDLLLRSPLLRVKGAGKSNLRDRTVDYRIEPKLVASLKGQGTTKEKKGVVIPIILKGPWDNVKPRIDLFGSRKLDPKAAKKKVKGFLKGLIPTKPDSGTAAPGTGAETPAEKPDSPLGGLKSLLPGQKN